MSDERGAHSSRETETPWLPLLVIVLVTAGIFLPIMGFNFNPASDDYHFILKNPAIADTSLAGFLKLIVSRTPQYNEIYPVTFASYWANYAAFGLHPEGYFATQIVLHLVNLILVFFVIRRISRNEILALFTSLIFAIHPLQVDTLAMLDQRENLLNTMFSLLAILSYLSWRESGHKRSYVAAVTLFAVALLADAPWVVLPMLLLGIDSYQDRRWSLAVLIEKIPFFFLSALFSIQTVLTTSSAEMIVPHHFGSPAGQAVLILLLFKDYLFSFFVPIGLSPAYTYNPADIFSFQSFLAVLLPIALTGVLVVAWKKKWRNIVFGLWWYAICFLPFSQIIPIMIVRADQFMYHTLIGPALITSAGIIALLNEDRARRLKILVIAAMVAFLAPLTLNHFHYYSTPFAFVQRFVDTQGWAPSAEVLLARVHNFRGEQEAEAECLSRAVSHYGEPTASKIRLRLAEIYREQGRWEDALKQAQGVVGEGGLREAAARMIQSIEAIEKGKSP
jgi:protein O-mannosyl-transferase